MLEMVFEILILSMRTLLAFMLDPGEPTNTFGIRSDSIAT